MPRFYTEDLPACGEHFLLTGETARHVSLSLRMRAGDSVCVGDGRGRVTRCRLEEFSKETVRCCVTEELLPEGELPVRVRLYQGCPKGDKLDLIVMKAVELGVAAVHPFVSARCVSRPRPEKQDRLTERLSRIARQAAGQCGRDLLPAVYPPCDFRTALGDAVHSCDRILFCYEEERGRSLRAALDAMTLPSVGSIGVFVGSEGGFSPEEADAAVAAGALSVGLGGRILRCETAPLFVLSCIGYRFSL